MLAGQSGAVPMPLASPYAAAPGRQPHYAPGSAASSLRFAPATGSRIQGLGSPTLSTPALGTQVLASPVVSSPALSSSAANSARFPAVVPEVRSSTDVARLAASPSRVLMRNGLDSANAMALSRPILAQHTTPESSATAPPFGSSLVPISRPQVSSPMPIGSYTELPQQDYLSPRRVSNMSPPRRGNLQGASDGYLSPRRASVQSGSTDGRLSPARGSIMSRSEEQGQMDQIASKYVKRLIGHDGAFKTDGIHGDRSDSFKAMESQALLRPASPQRTAARSQSPRSRNTWVPSGKTNLLAVSSPQSASEQRTKEAARRLSPSRSGVLSKPRTVEKCHKELYEDAFNRQQRLKELQQHSEQVQEREEKARMENFGQTMKEWRRLYKLKDTRSQAEREEEMIKKRKETLTRREEMKREQELNELRECTFKPTLKKRPGLGDRCRSPKGQRFSESDDPPRLLQQLLDRQRSAVASLQELAVGDLHLREHLSSVHAEYHDRIQREETQRVVLMLQDADTEGSAQRELIDRVRRMVAAGDDPEMAQRQIVEELVARSQDEVKRRVLDAFGPIQLEAEGKLYHKRLSLVHELESIEAQVVALKGGTLVAEAREIGFEFGLADKSRRTLPAVPVLSAMRMTSGENEDGRLHRAHSTSSSNPTPRQTPRLQSASSYMRPSTPRSQGATSDDISRQSSGQQPSLSGSVLHPARHDSEDFVEASVPSLSALSLGSGVATSSSAPPRSRLGNGTTRTYGLVHAPAQTVAARPHSSSMQATAESASDTALAASGNSPPSPPQAPTPPTVPLSQALQDDDTVSVVPNGVNLSLQLGTSMASSAPESFTSPGASITAKAMPDVVKAPMVMQSSSVVVPMSAAQLRVVQESSMDSARKVLAPGQAMVMSSGIASPRSLSRRSDNAPAQPATVLTQPLQQQQLQQQLLQQQLQQAQLAQTMAAQPQVATGTYFTGHVQQGYVTRAPAPVRSPSIA